MKEQLAEKPKSTYHHGNLKAALVIEATNMIVTNGIEALSLRKLAQEVGVSRTAAYHHFKDKAALLSAIAVTGFELWQKQSEAILNDEKLKAKEKFSQFVRAYIRFANENAHLYELMFGREIWQQHQNSEELTDIAYKSFNYQVEMTKYWQSVGVLANENPLRQAQVCWGTLHGIARLLIDGIYTDYNAIDEMCDCIVSTYCITK